MTAEGQKHGLMPQPHRPLMADRGPTALLDDRLRPLKNGCSYGKF